MRLKLQLFVAVIHSDRSTAFMLELRISLLLILIFIHCIHKYIL